MEYYELPGVTVGGEKLYTTNAERAATLAHLVDVAEVEFTKLPDEPEQDVVTTLCPLNHMWW